MLRVSHVTWKTAFVAQGICGCITQVFSYWRVERSEVFPIQISSSVKRQSAHSFCLFVCLLLFLLKCLIDLFQTCNVYSKILCSFKFTEEIYKEENTPPVALLLTPAPLGFTQNSYNPAAAALLCHDPTYYFLEAGGKIRRYEKAGTILHHARAQTEA